MKILFLTVSDKNFFIGTLATVNSILKYHTNANVAIVDYNSSSPEGLSEDQKMLLQSNPNIIIYSKETFMKQNRILGGWQFKTYAIADILNSNEYDIVVGIDSDCCIVSNLQDIINTCLFDGKMRGGQDGAGPFYDSTYEPYEFGTNIHNNKYMSTSLYFVPNNDVNKNILTDAANYTNKAVYGPQEEKVYPGHGDQGILNAAIYKHTKGENVELLENEIWSMHWTYDSTIATYENDLLTNKTYQNKPFRSFHSPSMGKIWTKGYSERNPINQEWIYASFLDYLFLGQISLIYHADPFKVIGSEHGHLYNDLIKLKDKIRIINKDFYEKWDNMSLYFLDAICKVNNFHRMMTLLPDASMWKYIQLVKTRKDFSNILEVGSYQGGSIITLALATIHKNFNFYSVESFMGSENGTVDGWPLPDHNEYLKVIKHLFPSITINNIKAQSICSSRLFPQEYFDFIFIDGSHEEQEVSKDIANWFPKLTRGGIMAGDDISWGSVRAGVSGSNISFEEGNDLWWHFKT